MQADSTVSPPPSLPDDPFAGLPEELGAIARETDTGMRREMRWLAGALQVAGFPLAAYIAWYVVRQGRMGSPRQEEWLPAAVALALGILGVWIWRRAATAPLVRGLVARFPDVRQVRIQVTYGRNNRRLTGLAFDPFGPGLNVLHIGNMPADDPQALRLLEQARQACARLAQPTP